MTPIGHSIVGMAFGTACLPKQSSFTRKLGYISLFVILANIPDLPIPYWGHDRYFFSHSFFVNLFLIGFIILILRFLSKCFHFPKVSWQIIVLGSLAILSHLLMDSFYNHGLGIPIFWPLSDASLVLPIPWLSVQQGRLPPPITYEMAKIWLIELLTFSPFLGLVIWLRRHK